MTTRERRIAILAGVAAGGFALLAAHDRWFVQPLEIAEARTRAARDRLNVLIGKEQNAKVALARLNSVASRAFAGDPDLASARASERLTACLERARLDDKAFTRIPLGRRAIRGATEVGWSVQGSGPLDRVVDFLSLLERDETLHRLDGLVLGPTDDGGVHVQFRYATLVVEVPAPKEAGPRPLDGELDEPERLAYAEIVRRDIFRPWAPPPPPPKPKPKPPEPPPAASSPEPGPENYRVVSLTDWGGVPEVMVRDATREETTVYHTGDRVPGGTIVLVDYRPLPRPDEPALLSYARIIIESAGEYWAVDGGKTFADKYRLPAERLPDSLRAPTSAHGE